MLSTNSSRFRPHVERLEDRDVPAQFGVPWPDAAHLTVSFAPDGTTALGESSRLFAALDAQMPRDVWQGAILRAFQTWSEAASINVGVTTDGGQAFGIAGPTQGDTRFGDIRVGGLPMSAQQLAVAVPPSAYVAGTLAGDIFINTAETYTPSRLYAVALHEVGHALGMPPSTNRFSVMFQQVHANATLGLVDQVAVRALYGTRAFDLNELAKRNDTARFATRIDYRSNYDGDTPLVVYGDLSTRADVDYFSLKVIDQYTGPVTFRLQTDGISMMAPRLTVFDRQGRQIAQVTSTATRGGTLTYTLPTTIADSTYVVRVDASPTAMNRIGRYALAATFDLELKPVVTPLETVMRGAYESLDSHDIHDLFEHPDHVLFDDDQHSDDSAEFAQNLRSQTGLPNDRHYRLTASLADALDGDFYWVRAPVGSVQRPWVITASVHAADVNGAVPTVELLTEQLTPIPAEILVNGNGTYTIQVTGIAPRAYTLLRVSNPAAIGNYVLDVTYGTVAADLRTLAAGSLAADASKANFKLWIGQTQLMSLNLSTGAGAGVRMDIINSANQTVYSLSAPAGTMVSGVSAMLAPGEYTVTYTAIGGPTTFQLRGAGLTDPVGPVIQSSTLAPQYQVPGDPTTFLYPNGTLTQAAFLWAFSFMS